MDSRKKEVDAEFTRCYTLTSEAVTQLIADKLERAEMYYKANTKLLERQTLEFAK